MISQRGCMRLARLALRRDRFQLSVWIIVLTATHALSAVSMQELYPTASERVEFARSSAVSAVALAFNGLISGTSEGAIIESQTLLIMLTAAALMSIFAVVRHTRQNEETGRADLLRAGAVGQHALLTAALLVVNGANVVLGVLNTAVLVALGLPLAGSVATGASIASVGIAFAGVAALTAQLSPGGRSANGMAGAALGAAFALRVFGDMASDVADGGVKVVSSWPSWLSPIGWGQQIRPFHEHEWVVLALPIAFAAMTTAAAFVLTARRDLGAGLVPERLGPPRAHPRLLSPVGLAWRLQRGTLAGWSAAMIIVGAAYGAVAPEVEDLIGDSEGTREIIEQLGGGTGSLVEVYLSAAIAMAGMGIAAYTVQAMLRIRSEEDGGTLQLVLATAVGRRAALAANSGVVVAGTLTLLALAGASAGLAFGIATDDPIGELARLTGAALGQAPAPLVLGGITLLAFGTVPTMARAVAWGAYAACLLLGQLGEVLGLPDAILDLSPFTHLIAVPADNIATGAVVVIALVAAALGITGTAAFARRDLAP